MEDTSSSLQHWPWTLALSPQGLIETISIPVFYGIPSSNSTRFHPRIHNICPSYLLSIQPRFPLPLRNTLFSKSVPFFSLPLKSLHMPQRLLSCVAMRLRSLESVWTMRTQLKLLVTYQWMALQLVLYQGDGELRNGS